MTKSGRSGAVLPWALACLFVAGIVHIVTVLAMPSLAREDAYARLGGSTAGVALLPDAATAQSMPFQDPAAVMAVCRFDLDRGPARVRSLVNGDALVAISFHDRSGRIFYSTTDRAALRGKIDVLLVDAQQLDAIEASDPEDQAPQELRLVTPTRAGFVLVRALVEQVGGKAAATQAARAVSCGPERG